MAEKLKEELVAILVAAVMSIPVIVWANWKFKL